MDTEKGKRKQDGELRMQQEQLDEMQREKHDIEMNLKKFVLLRIMQNAIITSYKFLTTITEKKLTCIIRAPSSMMNKAVWLSCNVKSKKFRLETKN